MPFIGKPFFKSLLSTIVLAFSILEYSLLSIVPSIIDLSSFFARYFLFPCTAFCETLLPNPTTRTLSFSGNRSLSAQKSFSRFSFSFKIAECLSNCFCRFIFNCSSSAADIAPSSAANLRFEARIVRSIARWRCDNAYCLLFSEISTGRLARSEIPSKKG